MSACRQSQQTPVLAATHPDARQYLSAQIAQLDLSRSVPGAGKTIDIRLVCRIQELLAGILGQFGAIGPKQFHEVCLQVVLLRD